MQAEFNNRSLLNHSRVLAISDITNLQTTLDTKSNTSHVHKTSQITDLDKTLDEHKKIIEKMKDLIDELEKNEHGHG